ncbi:MAG: FAD-dependent oxidoreductase [Clostridium sp.]
MQAVRQLLACARLGSGDYCIYCECRQHCPDALQSEYRRAAPKGHLVREMDALGGEMGKNIDKTFIQSKMLNESKGPAVHSLRAQADKHDYSRMYAPVH